MIQTGTVRMQGGSNRSVNAAERYSRQVTFEIIEINEHGIHARFSFSQFSERTRAGDATVKADLNFVSSVKRYR